jgi:RNA polymerase sigma factor (sigma-70 family)
MKSYIPSASTTRSVVVAVVLGATLGVSGALASTNSSRTNTALPFEADSDIIKAITRYCQACWNQARLPADQWADCTQQVLIRLIETVPSDRWANLLVNETEDKRELLRAIDAIKKRTQRARKFYEIGHDVPEHHTRNISSNRETWEEVNLAAKRVLSDRQQEIVQLSATGWAVPEIADKLGTTPERISDEKYKAIRKLRGELGVEA